MPHPARRSSPSRRTLHLGVLGSLLVLVGGLVISAVPASSWVADLPWRHSMPGRMSGLVVVVGGLGLLSAAWIRLWRAAGHGRADLRLVRTATVLWSAPLLLAPPLFSRDGWSYAAQGELTRLGLSPYRWGPGVLSGPVVEAVDPRWLGTPTPYGPLPLLWGAGTARLVDSPWAMVVGHRVLALAGLAVLAWALPRLAAWTRYDAALVSALVLPSPLVLAHGVGGLHNDLLVAGLGAAALVVATERGWLLGAATGGLAAAVKLPGGLVCLGVLLVSLPVDAGLRERVGRGAQVALVSVATLVGVGVVAGTGSGWVHALGVPGTVHTPLALSATLELLLPGARLLAQAAALALVAWLALRGRTGDPGAALRASALALTATVLLSPVVHPWYALWCLPLAAACHLRGRALALLVWFSFALGITAPLDSELRGLHVAIALTATLVVGLAIALTWAVRPSALPPPARRRVRPSLPG
ncbi:polyprenol phosphomannose-dependent alpha 1,6 mannosyltransferase MptB [Nocardioides sp. 31GB23]|uniref:polyprenol phosphomannose-dependent alpha 1,6 mannosyltransferase MptB n=1 Tax=Nocardioides sp. 31GB23 TaxID=3156065 RepID=UPI0032AF789B